MRIAIAAATAASVLALSGPAFADCDRGETTIRFAHVVSASGHPKGEAATLFAERVNDEMNGRVCVEVFPNSQLYNDDQVLEALLLGDAEMAAPSLSKFEQFTLKYRVFDLPFLFQDIEAVLQAQFEALGSSPQKMAFSEVYGALQTGVVDGQENTWSNIYTQRFYEVQDGITETNHGIIDYLVVTSVEFWDSLDDADRADLERILAEVTDEKNSASHQINLDNRALIEAAGSTIRTLTPEQRAAWVEAMRPVWDQFADQIGTELIEAAVSSNVM